MWGDLFKLMLGEKKKDKIQTCNAISNNIKDLESSALIYFPNFLHEVRVLNKDNLLLLLKRAPRALQSNLWILVSLGCLTPFCYICSSTCDSLENQVHPLTRPLK